MPNWFVIAIVCLQVGAVAWEVTTRHP